MSEYPTNRDDVIDSRNVIEAIEDIEAELDGLEASGTEPDSDERAELVDQLTALKALAEECEGYASDWLYGETLIRDSYFEDYAQDLAEELGMVPAAGWPLSCIDWEQAARELRMDYTSVDFDGVTYWVR